MPSDNPNVASCQQYMPYPAGSPFNPLPFQNAPWFPPCQMVRPPAYDGHTHKLADYDSSIHIVKPGV
ncbi:hypothetical protein BDQ12DRAFT_365155 [Crucibulum laeve]|uniref:Uncharacterized protein n=1 Tax=Crucibulum laeve TaxID=68775 RepID=A0A5C3LN35_9AGAR|nr:hypothetical protein BDQ12DRAFT_365155 [Crucibulum laeve]